MTKRTYIFALAALILAANVALAAITDTGESRIDPQVGQDATALMQFYPTPLATSPVGAIEDKDVWLAKVRSLIAAAPPLLRQSTLASTTKQDFVANLTLLQQLQKGTLEEGIVAAKSLAKSGKLALKAANGNVGPNLGSGPADTVFTYLEPCRIMDTRIATAVTGVRGPLIGNQLYQVPGFITAGQNWSLYGGNGTSDCGLNSTVGGNIWAVAIVITILNPNFDAFLGVGDNATLAATLSTVALNYTHGQGLSTQYIVPQGLTNKIYFAMPDQLSANIIFDVVGYFAVSQATNLDCLYPSVSGSGTVPAGGTVIVSLPNCSSGYAFTGAACSSGFYDYPVPLTSGGQLTPVAANSFCSWKNNTGGTLNGSAFIASAACCRIPGR